MHYPFFSHIFQFRIILKLQFYRYTSIPRYILCTVLLFTYLQYFRFRKIPKIDNFIRAKLRPFPPFSIPNLVWYRYSCVTYIHIYSTLDRIPFDRKIFGLKISDNVFKLVSTGSKSDTGPS